MAINAEEVNDWFRCYYFKSTFDPEAGSFDHLHRWLIMSDHHLDRVHYFRPWLIKSLTRWLVNECLSIILDELGMFECVLSTEFRSYQIDGNIDRYFGALVNSLHNHLDSGWWTRIPRRISPPPPHPSETSRQADGGLVTQNNPWKKKRKTRFFTRWRRKMAAERRRIPATEETAMIHAATGSGSAGPSGMK